MMSNVISLYSKYTQKRLVTRQNILAMSSELDLDDKYELELSTKLALLADVMYISEWKESKNDGK